MRAVAGTEACPRCGSRITGLDCPSCGLELVCHACGAAYENPLGDRYCSECGERVIRQGADAELKAPPMGEAPAEPSRGALRTKARGLAGAASSAGARLTTVRPVRRPGGKSLTPRPVEQLELELAWSLVRLGRTDAAREMLGQALAHDARDVEMLLGLATDSAAPAPDMAVRALLEAALLRPDEARAHVQSAGKLVDARAAEAHGNWIATTWYSRIKHRYDDRALQAQSALLVCHVAMLIPDEHLAEQALDDACRADRSRVLSEAPWLLRIESVADELQASVRAEAMLARLNAAAGRSEVAVAHVDTALASEGWERDEEIDLLVLRGEQLVALGKTVEAAASYVDAGRLAERATRHRRATRYFRRATELDRNSAIALWYLADSQRLSSDLPTYPYVDDEALDGARVAWRQGMRLTLPKPGQGWVHLSGALIFEQVARMADNPLESILRAIIQAEQACALDGSADAWALACRFHRTRRRFNVAAHAAAFALELDEDNANANYEHVLNSVVTAAPDAIQVLDDYVRRFVSERDPVTIALRGYALMLQGELDAACQSLARATEADPTDIWALTRLALCLALKGDRKASRDEAARAWTVSSEDGRAHGPMHADVRAVAGLLTEAFDEAEEQFGIGMSMGWFNPVELRMGRAVASYMRGDPSEALRLVRAAGREVRHPGDMQAARLYLELLRHWDAEEGATLLTAAWAELGVADQGIPIDGAADRAIAELEEAGKPGDTVTPSWLGARAGVGRVLVAERRWQEALAVDEELTAVDDAIEGLPAIKRRVVSTLRSAIQDPALRDDSATMRSLTHRLAKLEQMSEAEEALTVARAARFTTGFEETLAIAEQAARLAVASRDLVSLRRARNLQGEILLGAGRIDEARERFQQALGVTSLVPMPAAERARLVLRLACIAAERGDTGETYRCLRAAFAGLAENADPADAAGDIRLQTTEYFGEAPPVALSAAFRALAEDHDSLTGRQRRALTSARFAMTRPEDPAERLDQISVQASPRVFPGDLEDALAYRIRDEVFPMRRRLLESAGVRIPGVGVGPDPALEGARYALLIHGVPYHEGVLPSNPRLVIGADPEPPGRSLRNAWTGQLAAWRGDVTDVGLEVHAGVVWLLEGVLRANLASFVTLPEVEHQIAAWATSGGPDRAQMIASAIPTRRAQTRLVSLIGRLAREQVAVNCIGTIVEVFGSVDPELPIGAMTDAARSHLIGSLPGAGGDRELIDVPAELIGVLRDAARPLERAIADDVLAMIRRTIGKRAPGQFALVAETEWRAPVQSMCERILPSVAVLSTAEREALEARTTAE